MWNVNMWITVIVFVCLSLVNCREPVKYVSIQNIESVFVHPPLETVEYVKIEDCECLCLFTIGKLETMSTIWSAVSVSVSQSLVNCTGPVKYANIQNTVSLSLRHW